MPSRLVFIAASIISLVQLAACVGVNIGPNPGFSIEVEEAAAILDQMEEQPVVFERPVLVLGGFGDPGYFAADVAKALGRVCADPDLVTSKTYFFAGTMDDARDAVLDQAITLHADGDEGRLSEMEFDVVGISMGGLIARYAAIEDGEGRRLNIRRLFTIATPHKGAMLADAPTFDQKVIAMRPGSPFLQLLDAELPKREYELICYVRMGDGVVGPVNAAPDGINLHWVPNLPLQRAHLQAQKDPRILTDIARRLRGETPLVQSVTPLPVEK
ncbi:MAG: hypothetical protein AAGB34_02530 [Planctomycetota bacterium]